MIIFCILDNKNIISMNIYKYLRENNYIEKIIEQLKTVFDILVMTQQKDWISDFKKNNIMYYILNLVF